MKMAKIGTKNDWGLTELEELFALEYFATKNATQSYLKVYNCNYNTAHAEGTRMRNKPEIKAYLQHLHETVRNDRIMTAEEVLIGLSEMARGDDSNRQRHQKIYAKDRTKALELLAKHYSLLTEVVKSEIEQRVIIVDDINDSGIDFGGDE